VAGKEHTTGGVRPVAQNSSELAGQEH